jgi:hypothetical protein
MADHSGEADKMVPLGLGDELPKLWHVELEKIATALFEYEAGENLFPLTLKLAIGEAVMAAYEQGKRDAHFAAAVQADQRVAVVRDALRKLIAAADAAADSVNTGLMDDAIAEAKAVLAPAPEIQ